MFKLVRWSLLLLLLIVIPGATALDFDNVLEASISTEYPSLSIVNAYGFGSTLAKIELLENTEQCLTNCRAVGTLEIFEEGYLFDQFDFLGTNTIAKEISHKIFIEKVSTGIERTPVYEEQCSTIKNNESKDVEVCENVQTGEETEEIEVKTWEEYDGSLLPAGKYGWKLEGVKLMGENIDWAFEYKGIAKSEIREHWAWWNGNWGRCKDVTIFGISETTADVPVAMNVTFDSDMQADFDDIRWIDEACGEDGSELPADLELKDDSNFALFWVNPGPIPTTNLTISMYYNNTAASSTYSDGISNDQRIVYHMGEASGNTINDSGKFGFNMTNVGTALWDSAGGCIFGDCTVYDVTNRYYEVANDVKQNMDFDNPPVSLTYWAHFNDTLTKNEGYILEKRDAGGFWTGLEASDHGTAAKRLSAILQADATIDCSANDFMLSGQNTIKLYQWNHVAWTYHTNKTMNVYINGTLYANCIFDTSSYDNATDSLKIGGNNNAANMNGSIDEVVMWENALTFDEVNFLYQMGKQDLVTFGAEEEASELDVTLLSPADASSTSTAAQTFQINSSIIGESLQNTTFEVFHSNGSQVRSEFRVISGSVNVTSFSYTLPSDDTYSWNSLSNSDTLVKRAAANFTVTLDTIPPTVSPAINITNLVGEGASIDSNWNFSSSDAGSGLETCLYYTSDAPTTNVTVVCNILNITTSWTSAGSKNITYCANDTVGLNACRTDALSIFLYTTTIEEDKDPVGELDTVTYDLYLNMTDIETSFTETNATFLRSNVLSTSPSKLTGTDSIRFREAVTYNSSDGAIGGQLHFWNWSFNIQNATSILGNGSSDTGNTTVFEVDVDDCTSYNYTILNFTLFDEEFRSNVLPQALTNQSIETMVNISRGGIDLTLATATNDTNNLEVCMVDGAVNNTDYILGTTTRYGADDHATEYHYIDNFNLTSTTGLQEIPLYTLWSTDARTEFSTSFLVTYRDENFLPVNAAIVDLLRLYVEDGTFISVEHGKTDVEGQTSLHFVTEDVKYRMIVRRAGEIIYSETEFTAFCQAQPCQININSQEGVRSIEDFEIETNLAYDFDLNTTTRIAEFVFATVDGSTTTIVLNATAWDTYFNTTVCSETVTSSAGTLTCDLSGAGITNTTYVVRAFQNGVLLPNGMRTFDLSPDAFDIFGYTGIVMTFLVAITLALMAISTGPIAVISFGTIGLFVAVWLGVFNGSILGRGASIVWIIVAAVIVIWKMVDRRTGG